jgi:hypothetical protein
VLCAYSTFVWKILGTSSAESGIRTDAKANKKMPLIMKQTCLNQKHAAEAILLSEESDEEEEKQREESEEEDQREEEDQEDLEREGADESAEEERDEDRREQQEEEREREGTRLTGRQLLKVKRSKRKSK